MKFQGAPRRDTFTRWASEWLERDRNGTTEGGDRLIEVARLVQGNAEVAVDLRMTGRELERPSVRVDRLGSAARFLEEIRQIVVRLGMVGLQIDRAAKAGNRVFPSPRSPVSFTQVSMRRDGGGVDLDRPADQVDRNVGVARLTGQDAQQVQRIGMIRNLGQDLAIDTLRLGQSAGPRPFESGSGRACPTMSSSVMTRQVQ